MLASIKDVVGNTIPRKRRGRLGGWGNKRTRIGSHQYSRWLRHNHEPAQHFGIADNSSNLSNLLFVAALFWFLSALVFAFITESKDETQRKGTKNDYDEQQQQTQISRIVNAV